jgi:hypothetical protein
MKTFATVALSLIAIAASLLLLLSTVCAFMTGLNTVAGHELLAFDVVLLIIIGAAIWTVGKLNRRK